MPSARLFARLLTGFSCLESRCCRRSLSTLPETRERVPAVAVGRFFAADLIGCLAFAAFAFFAGTGLGRFVVAILALTSTAFLTTGLRLGTGCFLTGLAVAGVLAMRLAATRLAAGTAAAVRKGLARFAGAVFATAFLTAGVFATVFLTAAAGLRRVGAGAVVDFRLAGTGAAVALRWARSGFAAGFGATVLGLLEAALRTAFFRSDLAADFGATGFALPPVPDAGRAAAFFGFAASRFAGTGSGLADISGTIRFARRVGLGGSYDLGLIVESYTF